MLMLRRSRSDSPHILTYKKIKTQLKLSYEEDLVENLAREVKVLLHNHTFEEALSETEKATHKQYPHLFDSGNFGDEIS